MSTTRKSPDVKAEAETAPLTCGLVMPISALDGCSAEHWAEVRAILTDSIEAIAEPKFSVRLVSEADDVGVIQKRIVQNVYGSSIIVCDVSGRNANVMFELGMRLAFDKPVVLIKDDKTDYSFDTGIIEHLPYPRDLRFNRIVEFRQALAAKVVNTYKASLEPEHSPFLKNFGKFHVAALSQTEVPADRLMLELLEDTRREVAMLSRRVMRRDGAIHDPRRSRALDEILEFVRSLQERDPKFEPRSVIGNPDFYTYAYQSCPAARYYDTREEFELNLERTLALASRPK